MLGEEEAKFGPRRTAHLVGGSGVAGAEVAHDQHNLVVEAVARAGANCSRAKVRLATSVRGVDSGTP